MSLKLDEIIRALNRARNKLVNLEELSDEELDKFEEQFQHFSAEKPEVTVETSAMSNRKFIEHES